MMLCTVTRQQHDSTTNSYSSLSMAEHHTDPLTPQAAIGHLDCLTDEMQQRDKWYANSTIYYT